MWKDLSIQEKAALINIGVKNGLYDLEDIKNSYNKYAEGGPINPYSAGSLVDTIYKNSKKEEYLGEPSHHYDFTISEEEANRLGYYPDKRGHRDDRVKKSTHPTHPSRGKWNSLEEFELTDKGMENPNYTLFGLNDGGQDPQAVMIYKGGVVLPEITVTPKKKYVYNPYDNINIYINGGDLQGATPRRATPSKQRKSWETDEDYERRMLTYDESKADSIKLENERLKEQDRINREKYLKTEEGQQKQLKIQKEDSAISSMIHVPQQETSSLHHANNVVMDAMRSKINNTQLAKDTKEAIEQQYQDKLDKWHDYKKGIESTITGLELGLSGASLLGAYANYKRWNTASNVVKRGIANLLQKVQLPMQVGGTLIDAGQTYNAIQNDDTFDTYYNAGSALLGTAGSVGASDVFLNSRFHNPKIDRALDVLGILQNTGDFVKFGYDTLSNKQDSNKYAGGGYKPSSRIKKQIANWEGSTMKVNRSFEDEARDFNYSLPKGATSKLSQSQLDGLYSYSYNVGAGRFRQRVKPVLTKYLNGEATIQDVQKSMWASKDSQLRGLAKRRNVERSMFGGNYQSPLMDNLVTQNLIQSLPSVYDYKPPIIPQIEYTPDPSIIDNLTEEYTGIPEIMDRPVEVNPANNFLKVYNLLNNIRR